MVVAFHLEQHPQTRLDFNPTCITAESSAEFADIAGQQLKPLAGAPVAAMLAPLHAKHRQFRVRRLPP